MDDAPGKKIDALLPLRDGLPHRKALRLMSIEELTERGKSLIYLMSECVLAIKATQVALDDVSSLLPAAVRLAAKISGTHGLLERALRQRLEARIEALQDDKAKIQRALDATCAALLLADSIRQEQ